MRFPLRALRSVRRKIALPPGPVTVPFTYGYVTLLLVVAVVFDHLTSAVALRAMSWTSTDAQNLEHHPILALLTSAFWLPAGQPWLWAVVLAVVLAMVERRTGTLITIAIFASGHVLATLVTELPVVWAVSVQLLPQIDAQWLDIGVSYGFFTVVGALLTMVPRAARWWLTALVIAAILEMYLRSDPTALGSEVTVAGHLASLMIGMFAWWPWLRRAGLIGSLRLPGAGLPDTGR